MEFDIPTRKNLIFILLLSSSLSMFSQIRYYPGRVLLVDGDTLTGSIAEDQWFFTPDSIEFRYKNSDSTSYFTPDDIKGFIRNGVKYISREVDVEVSPYLFRDADNRSDFRIARNQIFLEEIFIGNKSLFGNTLKNGKSNFYIYDEGDYELLKYKVYKKHSTDKYLSNNEAYKKQLKEYLNCFLIYNDIDELTYSKNDLLRIFKSSELCNDDPVEFVDNVDKWKYGFHLYGGVTLTNLSIVSQRFSELKNVDLHASVRPVFGFSLESFQPGYYQRRSILTELMLTSNEFDERANYGVYYYTIYLEQKSLNVNVLYQFNKPINSLGFTFGGGVFAGGNLVGKSEIRRYNNGVSEVLSVSNRRIESGLMLNTRLSYSYISLEFRYALGNGLIMGSDFRAITHRLMFMATVAF